MYHEEPDTEDVLAYENQDEEAVAMIEECPPGVILFSVPAVSYVLPCFLLLFILSLLYSSYS